VLGVSNKLAHSNPSWADNRVNMLIVRNCLVTKSLERLIVLVVESSSNTAVVVSSQGHRKIT